MQLWFARASAVPIREQLVTQIILGILSGDLAPGECLPSTREVARRFHIHPNTVSAGYRKLEAEHWVEARHGSGVYVRRTKPAAPLTTEIALDQSIARLFHTARKLSVPRPQLRARLNHWLAAQPPGHFLLVEPEEELRKIVINEMRQVVTLPIVGCSIEDCRPPAPRPSRPLKSSHADSESNHLDLAGAIAVALPSKAEAVRQLLPPQTEFISLQVSSIRLSLAKYLPAPADSLIAVASRWPAFLSLAHTMLTAAGFHPDSLVLRDAREPEWQQGLAQVTAIVCDSFTAAMLPKKPPVLRFSLLADASLSELRQSEKLILNANLIADIGADIVGG